MKKTAKTEQSVKGRGIPLLGLREARQNSGLSQRGLAELAGVASGTVHQLERIKRGGYSRSIQKLSAALGVTAAELRGNEHPPRCNGRSRCKGIVTSRTVQSRQLQKLTTKGIVP